MIIALDVHYEEDAAHVGAIGFTAWDAAEPTCEWVTTVSEIAEYEPGSFYLRELPCLMAAIQSAPSEVRNSMTTVIVDGYVWLDRSGRAGLGAHLYEALAEEVIVVGVAKNEFVGNDAAIAVLRGESERPLYVTAAGVDVEGAAQAVKSMHGPYRFPTLLRWVDQLSREY